MTASVAPLSPTYAVARAAFLDAARNAGARLEAFVHPQRGREGEELAVDVAELGPADAHDVVIVMSATHGVEGYCGSALQRHWLEHHAAKRPEDVRVVLVHALNPYGFSWVRRVNEDNIDLNRNFVDWSKPAPRNDDYALLAADLVPASWTDAERARSTGALLNRVGEWGMERLAQVVSGGQYDFPTGVFYGGTGPAWSHRWLRTWCAEHLGSAARVRIIDLHTGLGPWGVGELIVSTKKGDPAYERGTALWGTMTSVVDGDSVSALTSGDWMVIADDLAPHAEVTPVCIEYGTVDSLTVLDALRADATLHANGDPTAPEAAQVRAQVRAAFADDDPAWIAACWERFAPVMSAALDN